MKTGDNTDARGRRRPVNMYDCSWQRQSAQPTTHRSGSGKATSCQAYARSVQFFAEVLHELRVQVHVHVQVDTVETRTDLVEQDRQAVMHSARRNIFRYHCSFSFRFPRGCSSKSVPGGMRHVTSLPCGKVDIFDQGRDREKKRWKRVLSLHLSALFSRWKSLLLRRCSFGEGQSWLRQLNG